MRSLAVLAALVVLLAPVPSRGTCRLHPSQKIVLYGAGDDPGVFLWNSQFRLRAYHVATFDEAQTMVLRALLVSGGTRAVVVRCLKDYVTAPYGLGLDDAVDVRITSGPLRGRTGWIAGSDVRAFR